MNKLAINLARRVFSIIWGLPLYIWFASKGVVFFRWERLAREFWTDFLYNKQVSFKQKLWAYRRGFMSEKINRYNLTDDNYKDYISDFEFYHHKSYKNNRFYYWYDDKITTYYLLLPFKKLMPIHYAWVYKGQIHKLEQEIPYKVSCVADIIKILIREKELALKHTGRSRGSGFYKLSYTDGNFYIDTKSVSTSELLVFISKSNDSIITEYIHASNQIKEVYPVTPNICRLVTIYDRDEGAKLTGAQIRIGTSTTGFVENAGTGEVVAELTLSDGCLVNPVMEKNHIVNQCLSHPDTGANLDFCIPKWREIIDRVLEISTFLHTTPYLSYDIVITNEGFKLLEINGHGGQTNMQITYPFFRNKYQSKLFGRAWHES